jgi:hypothetical protein
MADFFHPLGIEAESLEAEPFSAIEAGQGCWWLRGPAWSPCRFDRSHAAEPDFRFLLDSPGRYTVSVDPGGRLLVGDSPASIEGPASGDSARTAELVWRAARHAVRAAEEAEAFILAAAALILANDPAAAIYAAGDDESFCEAVRRRLSAARSS